MNRAADRSPRRSGRRPGRVDTRGRVLDAARELFGDRGYDGATVRDVAGRAGVDPALLYHYFGSKQQLFVAAMQLPSGWQTAIPRLLAGPRDGIGERLVRYMLGLWESPRTRQLLLGLVRSATTDPVAAGMIRELLIEGPVMALARASRQSDTELRALLAGSQLIGLAMVRYVVAIEPVASTSVERLVAAISPTIQRYLSGDLEPGTSAGPSDPPPVGPDVR